MASIASDEGVLVGPVEVTILQMNAGSILVDTETVLPSTEQATSYSDKLTCCTASLFSKYFSYYELTGGVRLEKITNTWEPGSGGVDEDSSDENVGALMLVVIVVVALVLMCVVTGVAYIYTRPPVSPTRATQIVPVNCLSGDELKSSSTKVTPLQLENQKNGNAPDEESRLGKKVLQIEREDRLSPMDFRDNLDSENVELKPVNTESSATRIYV